MINFSKQPKEIAEEIVSYYENKLLSRFLSAAEIKLCHELAIHYVKGLLSVSIGMECFYGKWREPGDYTTLKSVLEILNQKIK